MINRYWRAFPWGLQLLMLTLLTFTLLSFSTYLVLTLLPSNTGISATEFTKLGPDSSVKAIKVGLLAQMISHIGTFAIPSLLFSIFTHPRVKEYLGLRMPKNNLHWLLVSGMMLGLLPFFLTGANWMQQHLHFGKWADDLQTTSNNMFQAFLKLRGFGMLSLLLFGLALLPAIGEEFLFRGILMRLFHRRYLGTQPEAGYISTANSKRSMIIAIIFSSLLFALAHPNPYGFIFIFLAGLLLAVIYNLTGSLLCSIWAHFLYNGTQVAIAVLGSEKAASSMNDSRDIPLTLVLTGLVVFALSFYALLRSRRPLPPHWSQDYLPGEV